jgi:hypothetical protein
MKDYQEQGTAADLRVGDFIDTWGDGKRFKIQRVEAGITKIERCGNRLRVSLRYGSFFCNPALPVIYRREV